MKQQQGSRPPRTCQPTVLHSGQLYPVIANPRRRIAGVSNCAKPLPFLLHEPRRSIFPSLSRPVPVTAWSTGFVHKGHPIDKRNPKIVLETCDRCKQREQKHSWLKDKWANLPWPFRIKGSEHNPV
jgi:hypothetical protein